MDGKAIRLVQYLEGSDKRFIIPVYQRNYSWKKENCRQLYDDLIRVITNKRKMHFFGSIVSVYNGTNEEFLVIDGQQRLTTISLLLLAMHNVLKDKKLKSADDKLESKVYEEYLVDKWEPAEKRIKLKAVNKDLEAFAKLFDEDLEEYVRDSDITLNYEYFYSRIQKEEITVDQLYEAIKKLMVINITVNPEDNPQLIFESLNSTGVDLTEGDKIRNYILMGLDREKQEGFYKKYWSKIETLTMGDNNADVSTFIRDYLSMKKLETPSLDKVYPFFKAYVQEKHIDTEGLLQDLLYHSKNYSVLIKSNFGDEKVDASIARLNHLETVVCRPFFMMVIHRYKNGELSVEDIRQICDVVENYLFRRNICDVATNALNKIFLLLDRDITKLEGSSYVERMKYVLSMKKDSGRFPSDTEFAQALTEKQVYKMRGRYKTYLFERLENWGTDEIKDVYQRIDSGKYTIEHIMPQTLSPEWKKELGDNYKEVHEMWLHRLANLTLTAYNSKYSNETFGVKRDLVDKETGQGIGFSNSGLRINQWVGNKSQWTEIELRDRNQILIDKAKKIWSYVYTDYKPLEKPLDSVSLDEDIDLTGRSISKYSFKGIEQSVSTWVEAYCQILKILHQQDASILTHLAYETNSDVEMSGHVSTQKEDFGACEEIESGIYVWTGIGTNYKITNLQKFFKLYGEDPQELVFYLSENTNNISDTTDKPRHILRRKYWTYALPEIKEVNKGGCFSNVNPCRLNSISGYLGINGFKIKCYAKHDCAIVQLLFYKKNSEINKEAFDFLFDKKDEIENKLGKKLEWIRGKDVRYSCVLLRLNEVSIDNEADWKLMSRFQAEWSKKFYDVMVPYIKEKYLASISTDDLEDEEDDLYEE